MRDFYLRNKSLVIILGSLLVVVVFALAYYLVLEAPGTQACRDIRDIYDSNGLEYDPTPECADRLGL